jgi:hypothetical protein
MAAALLPISLPDKSKTARELLTITISLIEFLIRRFSYDENRMGSETETDREEEILNN